MRICIRISMRHSMGYSMGHSMPHGMRNGVRSLRILLNGMRMVYEWHTQRYPYSIRNYSIRQGMRHGMRNGMVFICVYSPDIPR